MILGPRKSERVGYRNALFFLLHLPKRGKKPILGGFGGTISETNGPIIAPASRISFRCYTSSSGSISRGDTTWHTGGKTEVEIHASSRAKKHQFLKWLKKYNGQDGKKRRGTTSAKEIWLKEREDSIFGSWGVINLKKKKALGPEMLRFIA